jgi:hypothetical protein
VKNIDVDENFTSARFKLIFIYLISPAGSNHAALVFRSALFFQFSGHFSGSMDSINSDISNEDDAQG